MLRQRKNGRKKRDKEIKARKNKEELIIKATKEKRGGLGS
jgi:hypothetical protein